LFLAEAPFLRLNGARKANADRELSVNYPLSHHSPPVALNRGICG
jgi:hypothetical protein